MALLGRLLLREDRDFHTIQTVEAGFRQLSSVAERRPACTCSSPSPATSPRQRADDAFAQDQTWRIVERLFAGGE